jgi:N6-L-threonylcarbamoyladenine synthase
MNSRSSPTDTPPYPMTRGPAATPAANATAERVCVLGIETSCDETGVAVYDTACGLRSHALHSQVALHGEYGGVVPELASRDHIRRVLPLTRRALAEAGLDWPAIDAIAYTAGPGLAGALLVGASFANALAAGLGIPALPVHHLEGHLLSPLLAETGPEFPFVALLVSGGHTQLLAVERIGAYRLLGDTLDDAAGEAFDKTAQLLGLGYPGGPALARMATGGRPDAVRLPRPLINSHDLDFSFAGLKTAVLTALKAAPDDPQHRADLAAGFEQAVVDVLVKKCLRALDATGHDQLVVAGGVGANLRLRGALDAAIAARGARVHYPPLELCTDNGAMIALVGALRLAALRGQSRGDCTEPGPDSAWSFGVRPRWPLTELLA